MITLRFLVLLWLLGWAELGSASHEIPITADQMERLGISVVRIEPAAWVESDLMPARVVIPPRQERVVSAPSGGLVSGLQAGVGDEVEKGDMLALIESPALITLQREFLQAATEVKLASATLKRDQRLFKEGIIAERRYLETRGNFDQAKAALDGHRQALRLAGMIDEAIAELERSRRLSSALSVQTPTAGVILDGMAVVGQRVERSDPLFRLAQLKPLWLEIRVPLDRLSGVSTDAAVALPCESSDARVILVGRNGRHPVLAS